METEIVVYSKMSEWKITFEKDFEQILGTRKCECHLERKKKFNQNQSNFKSNAIQM